MAAERAFFLDLFGHQPTQRYGVRINPAGGPADVKVMTHGSLEARAQMGREMYLYEQECGRLLGDDRVPCVHVWTGTDIFAASFGSPIHRPDDSPPFALPAVHTTEEADALAEPALFDGALGEVFQLADRLVALCASEAPPEAGLILRICDIQSPFDIAALIWQKELFFQALLEQPEAVHRLLGKVTRTLIRFVRAFLARYPQACLVHFPELWLPAEWGICLSEDDAGSISSRHFRTFALPYLQQLEAAFGGISIHSCANSQHQWDNFLALQHIRYLNLFHPPTDLQTAIEKFSGRAVLVPGPHSSQGGSFHGHAHYLDFVRDCLALAKPETRFFFIYEASSLQEALELMPEIRSLTQ